MCGSWEGISLVCNGTMRTFPRVLLFMTGFTRYITEKKLNKLVIHTVCSLIKLSFLIDFYIFTYFS